MPGGKRLSGKASSKTAGTEQVMGTSAFRGPGCKLKSKSSAGSPVHVLAATAAVM